LAVVVIQQGSLAAGDFFPDPLAKDIHRHAVVGGNGLGAEEGFVQGLEVHQSFASCKRLSAAQQLM
jgi:hypothetical protein